ncbi:hypothetical protein Saso_18640 [Streptomyces asoensis]|uniref:Uncharacterized protein n=1 Tax=Streptomyces asoensis TaxID=249586 RepID=A0ABQ3RWG6_9ACTN|nr:hypothetical protein GCM10010496_34340 [Streptomyces asoensis]GHI60214.1 hypothetical protein Saso_18640 [Streptomyces asoensis]
MPSGVPAPRTASGRTEGSVNDQFEQLARDMALSVLALRVFGPGVLNLARRFVAALVRVGVREMDHRLPGGDR